MKNPRKGVDFGNWDKRNQCTIFSWVAETNLAIKYGHFEVKKVEADDSPASLSKHSSVQSALSSGST